jgi:hypothetical protein
MKDIVDLLRDRDNATEQINQYYAKRSKEGLTGREIVILEETELRLGLIQKEIEKYSSI